MDLTFLIVMGIFELFRICNSTEIRQSENLLIYQKANWWEDTSHHVSHQLQDDFCILNLVLKGTNLPKQNGGLMLSTIFYFPTMPMKYILGILWNNENAYPLQLGSSLKRKRNGLGKKKVIGQGMWKREKSVDLLRSVDITLKVLI